jgi:hypothetical protein
MAVGATAAATCSAVDDYDGEISRTIVGAFKGALSAMY